MKLILSSCDFSNEESKKYITESLPRPLKDLRVLFIPNENATPERIASGLYHSRLADFGFSRENVFVFDHTEPDSFRRLSVDIIYISGGNTFEMMKKIRQCGFDRDIINYVEGGAIYIGGSAGAHIASKSIAHVLRYDVNSAELNDFSGLGLFDGILICHYNAERFFHYKELCADEACNIRTLYDNEAFVYEK